MKAPRLALAAVFVSMMASAGCELIATVDRTKIPNGAGGGGGGATTSSTGGGSPECTDPSQCPAPKNECVAATCEGGACGTKPLAKGAKATQVKGNCRKEQCDGDGKVEQIVDETDVPNDDNACTNDVCNDGAPSNPPKPSGTACGTGGKLVCDGSGHCVSCATPADCGTDDDCKTFTCDSGTCTQHDQPSGTVTASGQTTGDCQVVQCDGHGGTMQVDDDSDLPVDGNECTDDLCNAGMPSNPIVATGTPCDGGAKRCDASGVCAECFVASDCPGTDTECSTRTCNAGVCGTMNMTQGTALAIQIPGDCKENVCDGSGGTTIIDDDTDVPDDFDPCTDDICTAGVPSHSPLSSGTSCGTGLTCDATGDCTGCSVPSDCPGTDDACKTRTCTANICGFSFTAAGTATSSQTAGDCKQNQCDGAGNVEVAALNSDVPADDGNACTNETCSAGSPEHPPKSAGAPCATGVCDGAGTCVACNVDVDCPAAMGDCVVATCNNHQCGTKSRPAGFVTQTQTAGDCKQNQCDGSGNVVSVTDNSDVPADDGNPCTSEVCNAGVPGHPNKSDGTSCDDGNACTQSDSCQSGTCTGSNPVVCPTPDQCHTAGACNPTTGQCSNPTKTDGTTCSDGDACTTGDSCQAGTCTGGIPVICTASDACHVAGTCDSQTGVCSNPIANDGTLCDDGDACTQIDTCQAGACTGGSPVTCTPSDSCHVAGTCDSGTGLCSNPAASDGTTCDDGNACTQVDTCQAGSCTGGNPVVCNPLDACHVAGTCDPLSGACSNPDEPDGTACPSGLCEGGVCEATPSVTSTSPADGATGINPFTNIVVDFSIPMNAATLTTKTTLDSGACSGSIQLSNDGFATCIPLGAPGMSGGNTIATMTPGLGLAFGEAFQIRVTTAALSSGGVALAAPFTTPTGFTTLVDGAPVAGVVISQVYGAGGNAGATYKNDFVELHNRGTTAASLAGWSVQYGSSGGTTWSVTNLTGTIPPGGYYLVQEASGGAVGVALPTADNTGSINMSATAGKVALVNATTALSGACPTGGSIVDLIGYGSGANCSETAPAPAPVNSTASAQRVDLGQLDTNDNATDFFSAAVSPHNTSSPAKSYVVNETGVGAELDYCALLSPLTISVGAGSSSGNVLCEIYEAGVTDTTSGDTGQFIVELGYGPVTANPESQAGWTWVAAPFLQDSGNNDQYQAAFTAPVAGTYAYTCRVTYQGDVTYCDVGGAGSNLGLAFDVTRLGAMTTE